jgi:hypothetical protein
MCAWLGDCYVPGYDVDLAGRRPRINSGGMTNPEKVKRFLKDNAGQFFCNGCLSKYTGITPVNQVNQITGPLRGVSPYHFGDSVACGECGQVRKCIKHG